MRARVIVAAVALAFLGGVTACCTPPKISGVAANWKTAQHTNTWCWAASTEMISDYYTHRVAQCDSSQFVRGNPAHCDQGCPGYCSCWGACGASLQDIKNNWTHWKFNYAYANASLSWVDVTRTLATSSGCAKSPIQVIWWWRGGGGHVVTAYAYADVGGQQYVSYYNPWAPDCQGQPGCPGSAVGGDDAVATYDWLVDDGSHTWGDTFHTFKWVGP